MVIHPDAGEKGKRMGSRKCENANHNYQLIEEDVTRKKNAEGKTEIWKVLFCTKCGNTKPILVATWDAQKTKKEEQF